MTAAAEAHRRPRELGLSLALGALACLAYLANGRELGAHDTEPTKLLALSIARGGGIDLSRYARILVENGRLSDNVTRKGGRLVSRYPVAPALLAVPFVVPQTLYFDRFDPGWDSNPFFAWWWSSRFTKRAAAILAALAVVAFHRLVLALGVSRGSAVVATIAVGLGSPLWTIGSQALWQHGPAALMLTLTLWLLVPDRPSRPRLALAGVTAGTMVACRAIDLVFLLAILVAMIARDRRALAWFLPAPIAIGAAVLAYNLGLFGTIFGGQSELEASTQGPTVLPVRGPETSSKDRSEPS